MGRLLPKIFPQFIIINSMILTVSCGPEREQKDVRTHSPGIIGNQSPSPSGGGDQQGPSPKVLPISSVVKMPDLKPDDKIDLIGRGICQRAAEFLAVQIGQQSPTGNDPVCEVGWRGIADFLRGDAQRAASCSRTVEDICKTISISQSGEVAPLVVGGTISVDQLDAQLDISQLTNLCLTDPTVNLACSLINGAVRNIKQFFREGKTDWGSCLGTDRLGACVGSAWGAQGWTNNEGIEMASGSAEAAERSCCLCEQDYYANDGWFTDSLLRTETRFTVIQRGDFDSGNCPYNEKKDSISTGQTSDDGYEIYYRYKNCRSAKVKGSICYKEQGQHQVFNDSTGGWDLISIP